MGGVQHILHDLGCNCEAWIVHYSVPLENRNEGTSHIDADAVAVEDSLFGCALNEQQTTSMVNLVDPSVTAAQ